MQTITQIYNLAHKNFLGVLLSVSIGGVGLLVEIGEKRFMGHALLDGLVLAILMGMVLRALWTPNTRWTPGIKFSAKPILELAIVLLGASVDLPTLLKAGPALAFSIVVVVVLDSSNGKISPLRSFLTPVEMTPKFISVLVLLAAFVPAIILC